MEKIHIQIKCQSCAGQAYLPVGEEVDSQGLKYTRYRPCPDCNGSGMVSKWVELPEFVQLLGMIKCPHQHTVSLGGFHFSEGVIWDDIRSYCADCGQLFE